MGSGGGVGGGRWGVLGGGGARRGGGGGGGGTAGVPRWVEWLNVTLRRWTDRTGSVAQGGVGGSSRSRCSWMAGGSGGGRRREMTYHAMTWVG